MLATSQLQAIWVLFSIGVVSLPYTPIGAIPVAIGLVKIFRINAENIYVSKLNWILVLLSISILAMSFSSVNYLESLLSTINIIPFFLFFASYQYLFQHPDRLRQLAWIVVLSSIPIVLLGFGQVCCGWDIALKIGSIQILDLRPFGNPQARMSSIFFHANALANYLQLVFILCMGLCVNIYPNRKQQGSTNQFYLLSAYLLLTLLALILTTSRSGWIVVILSISAMTIHQKWYFILGSIATIFTIIIGSAYAPDPAKTSLRKIVPAYFWARINDEMYPNRNPADTRESLFQFAWQLIIDRPWHGWGLQTFGNLYHAKTGFYLNHPHNVFLWLGYSLGIPMTLFFTATIGYMFYVAVLGFIYLPARWKSDRTIVFAYLLAAIAFVIMNSSDLSLFMLPINFLFWSVLTAAYGIGIVSIKEYNSVRSISSIIV
jgi:O-antigen ligase